MERTRKEYLVLRSDRAGEAGIVSVFSSRKKARAAAGEDLSAANNESSYWLVVLPEDMRLKSGVKIWKNREKMLTLHKK